MKPNSSTDPADTKHGERPVFDRQKVARVLAWLGMLFLGIGVVFMGKFLWLLYWR